MDGPSIKQSDSTWCKTFLIAFIDDASRVITHGEFFYRDNTENMIEAFRVALLKGGKPEGLYFEMVPTTPQKRSYKPACV
ncbi:MAG: hypothetical protein ACJAUP_002878 [Cellvibrionaceae bacterium]|jgi:hypothetical protein